MARVRIGCAQVIERAEFVSIDQEVLDRYQVEAPAVVPVTGEDQSDEAASLLVVSLDAINFGSGYHDIIRKRPGLSGAASMATRLTDYVTATGPLTASRLSGITPTDASLIFEQELDGGALEELMIRFSSALSDLGGFLNERHGGSATQLISSANGSAVSLAEALTEMPFYRDVEQHLGEDVAFYKRAQITAADLARAGHRFDDLRSLTAFADNLVPHVLRVDGVLTYDHRLAEQIDTGDRLKPGSQPEVEIRAAGVHVVELLATRTGQRPMDIDLALWQRGGESRYKAVRRHRSRSVFY